MFENLFYMCSINACVDIEKRTVEEWSVRTTWCEYYQSFESLRTVTGAMRKEMKEEGWFCISILKSWKIYFGLNASGNIPHPLELLESSD